MPDERQAEEFSAEDRELLGGLEFAACVGTFYSELAERLLNGVIVGFDEGGVTPASVHTFEVPGAFELPLGAKWCAESGRFAGVACLGAVICGEAARGIQQVQVDTGIPCAFGVLTCENMDQALARSAGDERDQGKRAAHAVMGMALLREGIDGR